MLEHISYLDIIIAREEKSYSGGSEGSECVDCDSNDGYGDDGEDDDGDDSNEGMVSFHPYLHLLVSTY